MNEKKNKLLYSYNGKQLIKKCDFFLIKNNNNDDLYLARQRK